MKVAPEAERCTLGSGRVHALPAPSSAHVPPSARRWEGRCWVPPPTEVARTKPGVSMLGSCELHLCSVLSAHRWATLLGGLPAEARQGLRSTPRALDRSTPIPVRRRRCAPDDTPTPCRRRMGCRRRGRLVSRHQADVRIRRVRSPHAPSARRTTPKSRSKWSCRLRVLAAWSCSTVSNV
jgi:hypothetical protein